MIKAREALAIAQNSDAAAYDFLTKILDRKIREAAEKGLRKIKIDSSEMGGVYTSSSGTRYSDSGAVDSYMVSSVVMSVFQQLVTTKLENHGYAVTFGATSEPYVPRSREDDDNAHKIVNIGMTITW